MSSVALRVTDSIPPAVGIACIVCGSFMILFGRHFEIVSTFVCAFMVMSECCFMLCERAGVDFVTFHSAYAFVLIAGGTAAAVALLNRPIGRFIRGSCLGLMTCKLVAPAVLFVVPAILLSDICQWVALGLALVFGILGQFDFTENLHRCFPTILGALILIFGVDATADKHMLLGKHAAYGAVVCKDSTNLQACLALFSLWPVLSLCGLLFQILFPMEPAIAWAYKRLNGGYEEVPSRDSVAIWDRPRAFGNNGSGKSSNGATENERRGGNRYKARDTKRVRKLPVL